MSLLFPQPRVDQRFTNNNPTATLPFWVRDAAKNLGIRPIDTPRDVLRTELNAKAFVGGALSNSPFFVGE